MVSCKDEILLKTELMVWSRLNEESNTEYPWSRLYDGVWERMGYMRYTIEFELRS